jgi:recombination DNA repair RAD52 pathway protein
MFTPEQVAELTKPLDASNVAERTQSGRKLSYIEGWHAIAEANRIFGHDAWDRETVELRLVAERARKIGSGENVRDGWGVSYVAKVKVRVTVGGDEIVREGTGAGHGIDADLGLAHESAIKESETDAMKRALMTFGNPFGLALYDKSRENVVAFPTRKSAAQAKRDGDHEKIKEQLAGCKDMEQLGAWGAKLEVHCAHLPLSWLDPIRDEYEKRRNELIEEQHEREKVPA